ncbi:MAG TPA: hypothetical protein VE596_09690 [Gaiellaceae bacterium]|nr:hypothetical protein [Gaiellaceae bacterium]
MTRRGFVKRLGTTLAIGLGVALAPAVAAKGDDPFGSTHCCPSTCTPPGGSCPAGTHKFYCTGSCPACCTCLIGSTCQDFVGGCIC